MVTGKNTGRRLFNVLNLAFCFFVGLICILPVVHMLAVSLSSKQAVFARHVYFWPVEFTLDSYRLVVQDAQFFVSYLVSIKRVALGWIIQMSMTLLAAYPLSLRKNVFPARQFFVWYFLITTLFYGGMIPSYLVVNGTHLFDTIWALVIPGAVPVFNIILMKNFIKEIPDGIMESAHIDGAGHLTTLLRITLPLSKACVATITLFIVLGHWNEWFGGMIYIRNQALKPLQTYLRSIIIVDGSVSESTSTTYMEDIISNVTSDSANGAKTFLALIPTMCLYPFLQKYFAKGLVMGSVKG